MIVKVFQEELNLLELIHVNLVELIKVVVQI